MGSRFSIWHDNGRLDYGVARPRLSAAGRLGVAVVTLAVAGISVRSVYPEMIANDELGRLALAVPAAAIDAGRAATGSSVGSPLIGAAPIGFAPVGVADRVAIPDQFARPALVAFADARTATPAADAALPESAAAKPEEQKPEERSQVAKKKSAHRAPAVQVYELPDGRHVTMRRAVRNAYGYAGDRGFRPWDGFASAPRSGRRAQISRPAPFGF
jgi:hypothetical protein